MPLKVTSWRVDTQGSRETHLESCLLAHSAQVCAFCIYYSRCLAGMYVSLSFLLVGERDSCACHFCCMGPGSWHWYIGCCNPPCGALRERLLQMFGARCHDSQLQSLAGLEHWEGRRWGHVPACLELALDLGSGQWGILTSGSFSPLPEAFPPAPQS